MPYSFDINLSNNIWLLHDKIEGIKATQGRAISDRNILIKIPIDNDFGEHLKYESTSDETVWIKTNAVSNFRVELLDDDFDPIDFRG